MFTKIDADGSGACDLAEIQEALTAIWPYMDASGFSRAFHAADEDESGEVEIEEFVQLVKFTVWLNDNRHRIQELEDAFGGDVGESEFYFGCQNLGLGGSEGDAKYLYDRHCKKLGRTPVEGEGGLSFEEWVIWAAKEAVVASMETAEDKEARRLAIMSKELQNMEGEYGDVHFQDLTDVLMKGKGGGSQHESDVKRKFKAVVRTVTELSELMRHAVSNSITRNDSFPQLPDETLRRMVQMVAKEEYFSGQNIIMQGDVVDTYYVLKRGKVDVMMGDNKVNQMEPGDGFGEISFLLHTKSR